VRSLLARVDVDAIQFRALFKASLKADFSWVAQRFNKKATGVNVTPVRTLAALRLVILVYFLAGVSPAVIVYTATDRLFGATMMVTFIGFMVLSALLIGEGSGIVSPVDHDILGFRPVTSRTYFAVRLASISVRTLAITTLVALAPIGVYLLKGGLHLRLAVGALLAAFLTGVAVTLAVVAMYGWLLRVAGPTRLLRYTAYVQLIASTLAWGGFVFVTQGLAKKVVAGVSLEGSLWVLLYPGTWFGSLVPLISGRWDWSTIVPVLMAGALIVALAASVGGKLSMGYAASLRQLKTATMKPAASGRRWMGLLSNETRGVAILVWSQLQNDMKLRIGIISLLPITGIYLFMNGWPTDPFVHTGGRGTGSGFIQVALQLLPMTLRRSLVTSDAYLASWIFFTTPSDRAKLVLSARNLITLFVLVPFVVALAALFAYSFGNPLHAIVHAAFLGMISYLVLQFIVMLSPQLPFSMQAEKDKNAGMTMWMMAGVMFSGVVLYLALVRLVYRTTGGMWIAAVALIAIAFVMDRITRLRAVRRSAEMTYEG
jgi:hypothetical protein